MLMVTDTEPTEIRASAKKWGGGQPGRGLRVPRRRLSPHALVLTRIVPAPVSHNPPQQPHGLPGSLLRARPLPAPLQQRHEVLDLAGQLRLLLRRGSYRHFADSEGRKGELFICGTTKKGIHNRPGCLRETDVFPVQNRPYWPRALMGLSDYKRYVQSYEGAESFCRGCVMGS